MAFSEATKLTIKHKSDFKCCVCHAIGVEVHHLIPQAEGGPDTEDNAAPLCPSCHEIYGANPQKRKFIREMREYWYGICEKQYASDPDLAQKIGNMLEVMKVLQEEISALKRVVTIAEPFSSCFISFSESDDPFAERLYKDLQAAGVQCWRWKEDAPWGRNLMRSIDEAVHIFDKVIIICSEQSLHSPAVIREIERALQKEDELAREGKWGEVLFPIRLDDYIFAGWNHSRKADVIAKNVGDFRQWEEIGLYRKALNRLIRDLKLDR